MSDIAFVLNGTPVRLRDASPMRTLLDWLREDRGLTGTKEGCNEGDCGACSVMLTDAQGTHALNACILLLGQLHGKALRTVEGLAGADGTLHPVQKEMVSQHASQCGFCTPGFVVTMAVNHLNGETGHDTALAGNLCRCTGYAPIVRAAKAAARVPVPDWLRKATDPSIILPEIPSGGVGGADSPPGAVILRSADALAQWYGAHPEGCLIAGATDVGLWVTKGLRELENVAFIAGIDDLRGVALGAEEVRIGAVTTLRELALAIAQLHPDFAELIRRYGSAQVRNAATIGGNIANGSPIGDGPPVLIALGATLHLRHGASRRSLPLEDFFLDYGKQDRAPGEFIEAVSFPRQPDRLRCYKLSKRFDQDISAVCGCFSIRVEEGIVCAARLAFGGLAGTPRRAVAAEAELLGQPWSAQSIEKAARALTSDFTPVDDMRASARYRMLAAQGMVQRYWLEDQGATPRLLEVAP